MEAMIHPFEKRGLGKAPFRLLGIEEQEISHGQRVLGSVGGCEITTKPGGTCAFCGQYIVNMFKIESSDGQRFHVGCDCVQKVDADLLQKVKKQAKVIKLYRDQARVKAAKAALPEAKALFCQPHPNTYLDSQGKKLWHWCEWMLNYAGLTGQLNAARVVEKALTPKAEED